jgi:hypothetical protein
MKKSNKVLVGLILAMILIGGTAVLFIQKREGPATAKSAEIITISQPRGDEYDPGPAEYLCKIELEDYTKGVEFKNKGFSECKLIESKIVEEGCPLGGCNVCKLECK